MLFRQYNLKNLVLIMKHFLIVIWWIFSHISLWAQNKQKQSINFYNFAWISREKDTVTYSLTNLVSDYPEVRLIWTASKNKLVNIRSYCILLHPVFDLIFCPRKEVIICFSVRIGFEYHSSVQIPVSRLRSVWKIVGLNLPISVCVT